MTQRLISRHPEMTRGSDAPLGYSGPVDRGGAVNPRIEISSAVVSIFPWWLYEYPSAQDWNISSLNFTATGGATTTVPGFTYTIGAQNIGVIKFVEMSVQSATPTMLLYMNLLVNGGPVNGYTRFPIMPGGAGLIIKDLNDMVVRMPQGSTLTATFDEDSGASFTCSLQATGWEVPLTDVQRLSGGLNY
jgi:hypothetical protein